MAKNKTNEPIFTRSEVAQILNVSSLTIANREKNKKYPAPKRDMNSYRIYTLNDIFNLQLITYNMLDPKPVISILYDKGYSDTKLLGEMIDNVLSRRKANNVG
jgi:DNA-binding XRE family transcriptional regulator